MLGGSLILDQTPVDTKFERPTPQALTQENIKDVQKLTKNQWFFEGFEITGSGSSFLLIIFQIPRIGNYFNHPTMVEIVSSYLTHIKGNNTSHHSTRKLLKLGESL